MEEIISETLQSLLDLMRVQFSKIDVRTEEEHVYRINIETDEPQHLIGYHGGTLFAVQHLLKILLKKKTEQPFKLQLDVDNYRKRQEDSVITMAEEKVEIVRLHGKTVKLPPMSPYFRRLIHLHLAKPEFDDVTTHSEGDGNYRAVVISVTQ